MRHEGNEEKEDLYGKRNGVCVGEKSPVRKAIRNGERKKMVHSLDGEKEWKSYTVSTQSNHFDAQYCISLMVCVLFHSILFSSLLFSSLLFSSLLFSSLLFSSILFYFILFYSILFYELCVEKKM